MKLAAEKALADSKIDDNALKVFVVPEFYFRGKLGAYEMDTVMGAGQGDSGLVGALKDVFSDNKWEGWLILAGSIIGYSAEAKEKEVAVQDILIPVYKPADKNPTDNVKKPVNADDFTVEEALRIAVLEKKFLAAFESDETVKSQDDLEGKAEAAAKSWVKKEVIADTDLKRVVDVAGPLANTEFAGIDDSTKLEQCIEANPFTWKAATDVSKAKKAYNIVPVIQGGTGDTRVVMKDHKSPIDFIKKTDVDPSYGVLLSRVIADKDKGNDGEVNHLDDWKLVKPDGSVNKKEVFELRCKTRTYGEITTKHQYLMDYNKKVFKVDPLGIFKIGNISFAVDICLDHAKAVVKKMINALNHEDMEPVLDKVLPKESIAVVKAVKTGVDVHLVPSCGLEICEDGIAAKTNGYVFNCDGLNGKETKMG